MSDVALPWAVKTPFVEPVTVVHSDTDAMGHTNNVTYLRWLESVAWNHSKSLGMSMARYRELGTGCVARRHELDYLAATFEGEELLLGTWIVENDERLSMWRGYQIFRPADRKLVMQARTHWVCIDMKSGRPKRQPPEFIAAYRAAVPS